MADIPSHHMIYGHLTDYLTGESLVDMVHGMMDGNDPDPSTLTGTALEHYKTYKVLSGQNVFSESWLEL